MKLLLNSCQHLRARLQYGYRLLLVIFRTLVNFPRSDARAAMSAPWCGVPRKISPVVHLSTVCICDSALVVDRFKASCTTRPPRLWATNMMGRVVCQLEKSIFRQAERWQLAYRVWSLSAAHQVSIQVRRMSANHVLGWLSPDFYNICVIPECEQPCIADVLCQKVFRPEGTTVLVGPSIVPIACQAVHKNNINGPPRRVSWLVNSFNSIASVFVLWRWSWREVARCCRHPGAGFPLSLQDLRHLIWAARMIVQERRKLRSWDCLPVWIAPSIQPHHGA